MVQSRATTVEDYLNELPKERRETLSTVRELILKNLPKGFVEIMSYGCIGYFVPLETLPETYNGQPLSYAGLAAHRHHFALYVMCVYGDPKRAKWLKEEFKKAGKKLDMGKSCIRFKRLDDLALDAIAKVVASTPVAKYIKIYEASRKKK